MPKITRQSYRVGLIFAGTTVLLSEFWDWFAFTAFPNLPQGISAPALYFVDSSQSIGMFEIWLLIFFPVTILGLALFVSWLVNWLGEETHIGPGAGWRFGLLGFLLSLLEFSELVPTITLVVWVLFFVVYWLLFRKLGLNRPHVAA